MSYSNIVTTVENHVARVLLNRPDVLNALSLEAVEEITDAVQAMAADPDIRLLIFTGSGRAFCAGGDLAYFKKTINSGDVGAFRIYVEKCQTMYKCIEDFPAPTIAMVNGITVAGGMELLLSCDLSIACESAKIGDGHLNFGVMPGGGGAIRLPRKIPMNIAKKLIFTGELCEARKLQEWGLVNDVVPDDQLESAVNQLAQQILKKSPLGVRVVKRLIDDGFEQPLDTALRLEVSTWMGYAHSHDVKEGLLAFEEKRKPKFIGK